MPYVLFLIILPLSATAHAFQSYHIGNSLTWDSQVASLPSRPNHDDVGHHIRCAQTLDYMINNPDSTCVDSPGPFGTFSSALPGFEWDAVAFQPYSGTSGDELNAASAMINLAQQHPDNDDTKFFVYASWPIAATSSGKPSIDFPAKWLATHDYSLQEPMYHERDWYEWFVPQLRDAVPTAEVHLIPVGEVMLALDAKLKAGAYPAIDDASGFYRDYRHGNNVGRYIAHMTSWSVMHQTSPEALKWDDGFSSITPGTHSLDITPTEELSNLIRSTVWEVVSSHYLTGIQPPVVGDLNGDGSVDAADYTYWRDGNGTPDEYLLWKNSYRSSELPDTFAVPEPGAGLMALMAIATASILVATRRVDCAKIARFVATRRTH